MRAIEQGKPEDIVSSLNRLIDDSVVAPLAIRGIVTTAGARDLLLGAFLAQVRSGIVPADRIVSAVQQLGFDGLVDFYLMKFGPRPLSYNRMIRLLSDMHEKWILVRHIDAEADLTMSTPAARAVRPRKAQA